MNNELFRIIGIMLVVAGFVLTGEVLHRVFRAPKTPKRPDAPLPIAMVGETFDDRFSIRHLERFFLIFFTSFIAFLLIFVRNSDAELPMLVIGIVGVWWAFRRGVLR